MDVLFVLAKYGELAFALFSTALLIAAVIRGAARSTVVLLCGFFFITVKDVIPFLFPFRGQSVMLGVLTTPIIGWLWIAAYCLILLRGRSANDTGESSTATPFRCPKTKITALLGLGMGVAANLYIVWMALMLLSVPRGAAIRPMVETATVFAMAFASFLIGLPLSVVGCVHSDRKHRTWGILGIVLNLVVVPIWVVLLQVVAHIAGFVLEG